MGRTRRWAGLLPVVTLVFAPWSGAYSRHPLEIKPPRHFIKLGRPPTSMARPRLGHQARGGCGCATVTVDATNVVTDSKIRSGDASVENFHVTYIKGGSTEEIADAPPTLSDVATKLGSLMRADFQELESDYDPPSEEDGEVEVDVDQHARAVSGDAIAGQVIGVLAKNKGCANVIIRAHNRVKDTEVRSGDAKAINRNVILLDPGVNRDETDIDVDQHAVARSGQAIAGQVIGAVAAGGRVGRCGSVTVDADNKVTDSEIRSGKAQFANINEIRTCARAGCEDELKELADDTDEVEVCSEEGCEDVAADDAAADATPSPTPPTDPGSTPVPGAEAAASETTPTPSPTPSA